MKAGTIIALLAAAGGLFGQGVPTIAAVLSTTPFAPGVGNRLCPGLLARVQGTNLGTSTSIAVTVAGKAAAVLQASNTLLTIEIPIDAPAPGPTTITVGSSAPFSITLSVLAPGIQVDPSTGFAIATHTDKTPVDQSHPALSGETIYLFAVGLGQTNPVVPTGTPSPGSPATVNSVVAVAVDGQLVTVLSAVLVTNQVAQYQVTVKLPQSNIPSGLQPVQIVVTSAAGTQYGSNIADMSYLAQNGPPAPALTVQNNYSYLLPGVPNYGIAQGAIFIIKGNNLATTSTGLQNAPLQTTLNGVTINVTIQGTTVHPPIYYLTPTQIGAVLPSSTPVGDGQISVVNSAFNIGPVPIHVVQSAFGLVTLNGAATGMAAMYDVNFNYILFNNAVHPGEYVNLFGSGIGPSPDSDQNTITAPTNLLGRFPIQVMVGGKAAQVTYAGRTIYPGLDQVQIVVPAGIQPGCYVGVVVRTGNIVSNFASIPITTSGRVCSEPVLGIPASTMQTLLSQGTFTMGRISLTESTSSGSIMDQLDSSFSMTSAAAFSATDLNLPSIGSCTVYSFSGSDNGPAGPLPNNVKLNAGPLLNILGPNGATSVSYQNGRYNATVGGGSLPIFISKGPGIYSFDNAAGGPDLGPFRANATMASGVNPTWLNQSTISTVSLSTGVTVTWPNTGSSAYVLISGSSATSSGATFTCTAAITDGQFAIPQEVLLSLPSSALGSVLSVGFYSVPQPFTASGLDLGLPSVSLKYVSSVNYQ